MPVYPSSFRRYASYGVANPGASLARLKSIAGGGGTPRPPPGHGGTKPVTRASECDRPSRRSRSSSAEKRSSGTRRLLAVNERLREAGEPREIRDDPRALLFGHPVALVERVEILAGGELAGLSRDLLQTHLRKLG